MRGTEDMGEALLNDKFPSSVSLRSTASPRGSLRPAEPRPRYGVRGRGHPTFLWTAPGDESKQGGRSPPPLAVERGGPEGEICWPLARYELRAS